MRFESARDQVRGVGMSTAVSGGADASFGVGLQHEAAKIRDSAIDLIHLVLPECHHGGIQRIEGRQPADRTRASKIHRKDDLHSPGSERIRDAHNLRKEVR